VRTSALRYFLFVLGWSFLFWALAAARGGAQADPTESLAFLLGGAGPFVAAVVLTQLREAPAIRRDFWARVLDPRPLRWPWWAAALLLHPALVALAFAVDLALGGRPPALAADAGSLSTVLAVAFFVFWFGPLPEEMGWRGFALDRLQLRMTPLRASLVLGSVWALWHVPLFFVPGTHQAGLELGSPRSWVYLSSLLPLSVLITWVYNETGRSTLSAVLIHYSGNLTGAFLHKPDRVALLELGLLTLAAVLVVLGGGGRRAR